ncbi:hypothetical protein, partial [Stutzerimonas stutzeri]|uniref:hypothetical protein n=1 Tax=Stutzerimonas stutzeri TaxID=316 RepID=UPI002554AE47
VALMFQYQSNRSLADFRGVLRRRLHGSILSRVGASGKAGAVQIRTQTRSRLGQFLPRECPHWNRQKRCHGDDVD